MIPSSRIFQKIVTFFLLIVFLFSIFNILHILPQYQVPICNFNQIKITQNTHFNSLLSHQNHNNPQNTINQTIYQSQQQKNLICYKDGDDQKCISTHFILNKQYRNFQTRDFLVLQNKDEFLAINKQTKQRFVKTKQLHLKLNSSNIKTFKENNLFIIQSKKLYIIYGVQDRNIETCLFLQKTTSNYTQHIMPYKEQNQLLILSFPKRNQILLQIYDCGEKRLIKLKKIGLNQWVKSYEYRMNDGKLEINIQNSLDSRVSYLINNDLQLISQVKQQKYESFLTSRILQCNVVFQNSQLISLAKQAVQKYFTYSKQLIKIFSNYIQNIQNNKKIKSDNQNLFQSIQFFYTNKILKYNQFTQKADVISLGQKLIRSKTPVFHNIEEGAIENRQLQSQKKVVYYLQNNVIHSDQFIDIYEVHPKMQVQWVGFTKTFISFYPYNKESKYIRYIRTKFGGITFEGSKIKGKWQYQQKNEYQNYQIITHVGKQIIKNIWEAHVLWNTLFIVYELQGQYVSKLNLLTGYNGATVYQFKMNDNLVPQFVYSIMQNNELIISVYNKQNDISKVTKVQFYINYANKAPDLLAIKRQYQIKSRILQIKKINNNYIFQTYSNKNIGLYMLDQKVFSNRRPHTNYQNQFQKTVINYAYQPHQNKLQLYGVQLYNYPFNLNKVQIVQSKSSEKIYGVVQQEGRQIFYVFNIKNLITNKMNEYKLKLRLFFSLFAMLLLPIYIFTTRLKKVIQIQQMKKDSGNTIKQKKKDTKKKVN